MLVSFFQQQGLWELWETPAGSCRRFPRAVGRRAGFFGAAFHSPAASIARFSAVGWAGAGGWLESDRLSERDTAGACFCPDTGGARVPSNSRDREGRNE